MADVDADYEYDDIGDIMMFPMENDEESLDSTNGNKSDKSSEGKSSSDSEDEGYSRQKKLPLRMRRRTKAQEIPQLNLNVNLTPSKITHLSAWKRAINKAKAQEDPWAGFHIDDLPSETATRHRYNPLKQKWVVDTVQIKLETKIFAKGAMRECFRLKKLSSFSHSHDWKRAANYVAKTYMEHVDREVYFEDVRLQMDAKLWGEEYNRHNPPKKVDIFQMSILEFKERTECPLFHLEHYIEGEYIKYNSNSGFVDEHLRRTPQAFSHFTFERSGHQLIVVDIQGVGDLYTDPQIHTVEGTNYGDGNLGTKGMALFFHSHMCNDICHSLGLSEFDLSEKERESQNKFMEIIKKQKAIMTKIRGEEELCVSPSQHEKVDISKFLMRARSYSTSSCGDRSNSDGEPLSPFSPRGFSPRVHNYTPRTISMNSTGDEHDDSMSEGSTTPQSGSEQRPPLSSAEIIRRRVRFISECSDHSSTMNEVDNKMTSRLSDDQLQVPDTPSDRGSSSGYSTASDMTLEEEKEAFSRAMLQRQRPSCVNHELSLRDLQNIKRIGDSTLGFIHHDTAKYHEIGRFTANDDSDNIDWKSAIFHEENAAQLGVMEAITTMAKIYLQIPHDVLVNCEVPESEENTNQGVDYMLMGAEAGDRASMIYIAKAFETGIGLGTDRTMNWNEAIFYYEQALNTTEHDDSGEFDCTMNHPPYELQAKMADMFLEGKHGLGKDPQKSGDLYTEAADGAMAAMKGRLANKYYMLAEEAWAEVEEEEEG